LALPIWASAAIAWRWEGIAGVVLVLEGLLLSIPYLRFLLTTLSLTLRMLDVRSVLFTMAIGAVVLPPLVAGILFLAVWWRSRASVGPEDAKQDAG
jgi:hypothetical protein